MNNSKEYMCAGLHFKPAHTTERCTSVLKHTVEQMHIARDNGPVISIISVLISICFIAITIYYVWLNIKYFAMGDDCSLAWLIIYIVVVVVFWLTWLLIQVMSQSQCFNGKYCNDIELQDDLLRRLEYLEQLLGLQNDIQQALFENTECSICISAEDIYLFTVAKNMYSIRYHFEIPEEIVIDTEKPSIDFAFIDREYSLIASELDSHV